MRPANRQSTLLHPQPASLSLGRLRDGPPLRMPVGAGTFEGFRAWRHSRAYPAQVKLSYLDTVICIEDTQMDFGIMMPTSATTLEGFRAWARSAAFPNCGRISFLEQEIYFDMSPEEMETHTKVKEAVNRTAGNLNEELDRGEFYPDGVLLTHSNGLGTVPDGSLVTWETSEAGRVRRIPRKNKRGEYTEMQGTPDWVLEIVSNYSVEKDTKDLFKLYHRAGVAEYWLIDARGATISFQIFVHRKKGYVAMPSTDGWVTSPSSAAAFAWRGAATVQAVGTTSCT